MIQQHNCFAILFDELECCKDCRVKHSCRREQGAKKVYLNTQSNKIILRKSKTI